MIKTFLEMLSALKVKIDNYLGKAWMVPKSKELLAQ